ncbi:BsuPI-related putative proteinase inhibitor [Halobacterium rubrum]|uniref:BsuPI-related putative proteinase inhibitor n=1 Tax=Halobacterium TaxID=2239 RepID=UPI001F19AEDB|nr:MULTISPECIES: BsuPI-related putative proteinase inhibitor [Halobacterium]MDH5019521.1 BsuPI-related putative proteinase inhibitor [Halobacterium rubrum]
MTESDHSDADDDDGVLEATATATVSDDGALTVTLAVENPTDHSVECSFRDGQRIEVVAERNTDGTERWRYSDGRMFSMATGTETVAGGGELSFDATWPDPDPGDYLVRAWLVAADATAEGTVEVVVD